MAEAPSRSSGAIFRLQRLRRNVSEERSFLWNFQPIRDENSQPSTASCRDCSSGAPSNKPPPAVDVVHLFCRDPGPGLVIWGDSDSILPTCEVSRSGSVSRILVASSLMRRAPSLMLVNELSRSFLI
ncbi:hypothetical protein EYF80_015170 [Liparis tanakae]|uniref:Uncharacterized protein n=1 Tax=Liparis tanakae TaxID=230148 RepID=A0A4Z2IBZ0_9TELE|nr:hypothetical protein EYF80_015170 [Liparis tanakae]